jgi:staphylococcal nuclease domain-containing protein 1
MESEGLQRGLVKKVLSGDTLVVFLQRPGAPPQELQITMSRVTAPQMGRQKSKGKDAVADKPFAWESREFLRKLTIGKMLSFKIVRTLDTGRIFVNMSLDGNDLALALLEEGWATVSAPAGGVKEGSGLETYVAAEERARAAEKGQFAKVQPVVRPKHDPDLAEVCQTKKLQAIVERIISGSSYRVTLLPSLFNVAVQLAGVSCPDFIQDPEDKDNKKPEPFAREAKYFADSHILSRVVDLTVHGRSRFEILASVSFMGHSVEEELLRMGLAKLNSGAQGLDKATQDRLGKAEEVARSQGLRAWAGQQQQPGAPAPSGPKPDGNQFVGTVLQILNGGQLIVKDPAGLHRAIFLSSLRFPSAGNPKESLDPNDPASKKYTKEQLVQLRADRAWALAGTEFLRKLLVGKQVHVKLDFLRDSTKEGEGKRPFCTVTFDKLNVGLELVKKGFCSVVTHRGDEARAVQYSDYLAEEDRAKKSQLGVHGSREKAPVSRLRDLTIHPTVQAAKNQLGFLQREGQVRGYIEFIFNVGRYKIHIPKEQCTLFFSLVGVRPPQKDDPAERPAFDQGCKFVTEHYIQRECEIDVETVDKNGGFVGRIFFQGENISLTLLENGFVSVFGPAAARQAWGPQYREAERHAQRQKVGLWLNYDEAEEERKAEAARKAEEDKYANPSGEMLNIVISEVVDGSHFYYQIDSTEAQALEEMMSELQLDLGAPITPKVGDLVRAQFSEDDRWYRATVRKVMPGQCIVQYIDYGNQDTLGLQRIRPLSAHHRSLKPQAISGALAFIRTPPTGEEFGDFAAAFFREIGLNRPLSARVEHTDGAVHYVSLVNEQGESLNGLMVGEGLARIENGIPPSHPVLKLLREEERRAKANHMNIWQYGSASWGDEDPSTL